MSFSQWILLLVLQFLTLGMFCFVVLNAFKAFSHMSVFDDQDISLQDSSQIQLVPVPVYSLKWLPLNLWLKVYKIQIHWVLAAPVPFSGSILECDGDCSNDFVVIGITKTFGYDTIQEAAHQVLFICVKRKVDCSIIYARVGLVSLNALICYYLIWSVKLCEYPFNLSCN